MLGCFRNRGLLAAAAYDELGEKERERLTRHLARCPACRARADAFGAMRARINDDPPALERDLLPILRRRIQAERETPVAAPLPMGRAVFFGASAAAVAICFTAAFTGAPEWSGLVAQGGGERDVPAAHEEAPSMASVLAEAERYVNARDYTGAYQLLQEALDAHEDSPLNGQARLKLADLAYTHLQWYPEAHEAYEDLVRSRRDMLEDSSRLSEIVGRWNMLAEARKVDYASLMAYQAARNRARGRFEALEQVVAAYPGTYVASEAAHTMAELAAGENPNVSRVEALEAARQRSAHPLAGAQFALELGQAYRDEARDLDNARLHLQAASECPDQVLAERAMAALAHLPDP